MIVIYTKILLFQNVLIPPRSSFLFFKKCKESWACMHGVNTKQLLPLSNKDSKWFPALCPGRIYHARHACAETELLHRRIEDAIALGIFASGQSAAGRVGCQAIGVGFDAARQTHGACSRCTEATKMPGECWGCASAVKGKEQKDRMYTDSFPA